jgi:hypothetical protein
MATAFAPSRMQEWYWYYAQQIKPSGGTDLTPTFKRAADALADEPLHNGNYVDAAATVGGTGSGNLRVLGQKDTANRRAHLWVDNRTDTHGNTRSGTPPTAVPAGATISVAGMPTGTYTVTTHAWNRATGALTTNTYTVTVT